MQLCCDNGKYSNSTVCFRLKCRCHLRPVDVIQGPSFKAVCKSACIIQVSNNPVHTGIYYSAVRRSVWQTQREGHVYFLADRTAARSMIRCWRDISLSGSGLKTGPAGKP